MVLSKPLAPGQRVYRPPFPPCGYSALTPPGAPLRPGLIGPVGAKRLPPGYSDKATGPRASVAAMPCEPAGMFARGAGRIASQEAMHEPTRERDDATGSGA